MVVCGSTEGKARRNSGRRYNCLLNVRNKQQHVALEISGNARGFRRRGKARIMGNATDGGQFVQMDLSSVVRCLYSSGAVTLCLVVGGAA